MNKPEPLDVEELICVYAATPMPYHLHEMVRALLRVAAEADEFLRCDECMKAIRHNNDLGSTMHGLRREIELWRQS